MISRIAVSIVKKNIPIVKCVGSLQNLKLIHSFSDNNKKNPFQKFKRSGTPKNEQKPENTNDQKPKQNTQNQKQKPQSESPTDNQFKAEQNESSHSHRKVTGFNKFKRQPNYQQNLNLTKKNEPLHQDNSQKKQSDLSSETQKFQKPEMQQSQQVLNSSNKQSENIKIKGFTKFKKPSQKGPSVPKSPQKTAQELTEKQLQAEQSERKEDPILNSKISQDPQRQGAYKNTQKKIEDDKEEWENFLEDQIKKNKDKMQNSKKQKPRSPEWKNFDFTSRKAGEKAQKNDQKAAKSNFPFQAPKTPFQAMRMLFFGGIGIYLGSLILAQLFSLDNSRTVDTEDMIKFLAEGRIRQTWFLTTVQSLSQDSSRTKKYLCSTLENGEMIKCESNSDFEVEWNRKVDQFNIDMLTFGGANPVIKKVPIVKKDSHIFNSVRSLLSFALLFMFLKSLMSGVSKGKGQMGGKGGGLSGLFENSKSHRFRQTINVKFNDVVGMNKAKEEIVEFIDFLKNAEKYNKLGAKIPRGALLTGPPGTGKTMLAKACAGQSGVPFFTISGSQFMEMYVGVGAQRVRNLFNEAKEASPSIIFIDEIDAVGKKRSSGSSGGGNDQRDNTLNQLLVEMDGFDQTTNVIIFAATNQKEVLDPALTRPGRFDRLIEVELPDIEGRKQIFMVHLKAITLDERFSIEEYAKRLATLTPGFSGADIKNLCNQAAIIAARNDKKFVSMIDFELASQRIIGGVQKKSTLITPETKKTVAYHECGHGVVSWFMEHASPLLKLTIIPRSKGALGYAQYLPNENQVYTRKQLEDQICVILGGRISEQIFFKKISTGASDDLQKAHKVAKAIVAEYGMGKTLGWLSYGQTEYAKEYSHETEQKIDEQILDIILQCSIRTREIIRNKKDQIEKLAELLLKEETIDQRMIQAVLGERPFKSSKQYEDYIRQKKKMDDQDKKIEEEIQGGPAAFKALNLLTQNVKSTKMQIIENS